MLRKKLYSTLLKRHIRTAKRQWIAKELKNQDKAKGCWGVINSIRGQRKAGVRNTYNIKGKHLNQLETAENLNTYFSSIGREPSSRDLIDSSRSPGSPLAVSQEQVYKWLLDIDTKKATTSLDFPSWVTRMCAEDISYPLCTIINHCFVNGVFPNVWKVAEIVPIQKSKTVTSESDFRPISLLWHLGKVVEKAIMHFYAKLVLPGIHPSQFAYQKGKSTVDALTSAVDNWTALLDQTNIKIVTTVFLDMSKAFDRLDRTKLIGMLTKRNINQTPVNIIDSFLQNRHQTVRLGNQTSHSSMVNNGTPQGTLLGPMFWLLYVDELNVECDIIKYADDLTLSGTSKQLLQTSLDRVESWCKEHNMIANAKKSAVMNLSNKRSRSTPTTNKLRLNQEEIPTAETTKFLGITFDEHLTFQQHVDYILQSVRPLTYVLLNLKRTGIPKKLLTQYYISCIRTKITYGSVVWYNMLTDQQRQRLTKVEKLALKMIAPELNNYAERLEELQITAITSHIGDLCSKYIAEIKKPGHCLNHLLPPQVSQRVSNRHPLRLRNDSRTALRGSNFLTLYCNHGAVNYKE